MPLAHAVDWQGSASTDWGNAGNWSSASVPSTNDTVRVDGAMVQPVLSGPVAANSGDVEVKSGALTVSAGELTTPFVAVGFKQGEAGALNIVDGGKVKATNTILSAAVGGRPGYPSGTGAVLVDGVGSTWTNNGAIAVGFYSDGSLTIKNGGSVTTTGSAKYAKDVAAIIGAGDSSGKVVIDGSGSTWANAGVLSVGGLGVGALTIGNGGQLTNTNASIGTFAGGNGSASVDGKNSGWTSDGTLLVGRSGSGSLTISNGGVVTSVGTDSMLGGGIGQEAGATGTVLVEGPGSAWEAKGQLAVGAAGQGTLTIRDGGRVSSADGLIGANDGGKGIVTVDGKGSRWTSQGFLNAGSRGTGTLKVGNGGQVVNTGYALVGGGTGSTGAVIVDGAGSTWESGDSMGIGARGNGSLTIENGGLVKSTASVPGNVAAGIGLFLGVTGSVLVEGPGSAWEVEGALATGRLGEGTLTIRDGGRVSSNSGNVANGPKSKGTVVVDGKGSSWANSSSVLVGGFGSGSLAITNGGVVTSVGSKSTVGGGIGLDVGATGTVLVEGAGSAWEAKEEFMVGRAGQGTLTIRDGGRVSSDVGGLAAKANSKGAVIVDGKDSVWTNSRLLIVGQGGDGSVTLRNGGSAKASGVGIALEAGSSGTVNIGAAADQAATGAGTLDTPFVEFGDGSGKLVFNHTETDYRFAPEILGAGSLQVHAGTTQLGDGNSYSGGTSIHGGTLVGSASSFGSGGIANDASLIIDQPGDAAFANTLSGTGSFTKRGAGQLSFNGDGSGFTGVTGVDAGTLSVNGSLANSRVTVASSATLKGHGTVGSTSILPGGTIAPGNSIGTLNVNGNYAQAAGATYQAEVNPLTRDSADRIVASGTAAIAEGAILNVVKTAPGNYQLGTRYNVLTAQGGVKGTYKVTGDTHLSAFISLHPVYAANDVFLELAQSKPLVAAAKTPNQVATAAAVQALPAHSTLTTAVLNQETDDAARAAFDQISGDMHSSVKGAMIEDSRFVRGAANDRLRDAFCTVGTNAAASGTGAASGTSGCAARSDNASPWVNVFGSWGHGASDGNAARLDRSIGGFMAGVDIPVAGDWRLGVLAGASHSSFKVDARNASAKSDDYHLGFYGGTQWGDLSMRLGTAYTWHDVSSARRVAFSGFNDNLSADYNAATAQAFGELGYRMKAGDVNLEPFANLSYVNLHTGKFAERGGVAALNSRSSTNDSTSTTLGVRAATDFTVGGTPLTAKATLGWQHAFGNTTPTSSFNLAGGAAFDVAGVPIARDAALLEVGLDFKVAPLTTLSVSYAGKYTGKATDQSIRANLAMKF